MRAFSLTLSFGEDGWRSVSLLLGGDTCFVLSLSLECSLCGFIVLSGKPESDLGFWSLGGRGSRVLGGVGVLSSGDRAVAGCRRVMRNGMGPFG